jgi:hypothetical protein
MRRDRVAVGWAYQVIKFYRCDTLVDTGDDLLSNCSGVDMLGVEAVTQSRNTSCDLVKLNAFLASI